MGNNRGLINKVSTVAILPADELWWCVEVGSSRVNLVSGNPNPPTHSFDFAGEESM